MPGHEHGFSFDGEREDFTVAKFLAAAGDAKEALKENAEFTAVYYRALIEQGIPSDLAGTLLKDWHMVVVASAQQAAMMEAQQAALGAMFGPREEDE